MNRRVLWILISVLMLPVIFTICIHLGSARLSLWDLDAAGKAILFNSRIPQAFTAILAGAGLSVTGASMQAVLRNPLSSPFTLGVSSAAAFGAALAVICGGMAVSAIQVTFGAFLSALLAVLLILLLAAKRSVRPETIILIGVALSAFYSAGIMLMQYIADEQQLASIVYWSFGDTQRGTWPTICVLAVLVPLAGAWFMLQSWKFNALSLGEETARGLGVPTRRIRLSVMVLGSLLTAILTAALGIIGFVGLVVPHLCRLLVGEDYRFVLPLSFFSGAILLLVSDTAARLVLAPRLMPVAILTAFIGAPLFLLMLIQLANRKGGVSE
ncbi:MAG: iron ABC transporter permease [Planctomycetaceae bacterium]|nr:iron ABC transporter permease [Planctomycetaceae bacterium]